MEDGNDESVRCARIDDGKLIYDHSIGIRCVGDRIRIFEVLIESVQVEFGYKKLAQHIECDR